MLKSLRTAKAAATALFLVGSAATLHARAEVGPVDECLGAARFAVSVSEARDRGVPLPDILQIISKHAAPSYYPEIAEVIYEHPSFSPSESASVVFDACLKAKQI